MTKALHTRMKVFSRSKGHNAVKAGAYRSGKALYDEKEGVIRDYTRKSDVVHSEIIAPENAPHWVKEIVKNEDHQTLWNMVEASEKRSDSQLAREFEGELSRHLDMETNLKMIRDFTVEHFVSKGMIASIGVHNHLASDGGQQPHAHIMLTMRDIEDTGFGNKNREWNNYYSQNRQEVVADELRTDLATRINAEHGKAGIPIHIDPRSYKEQGTNVIPGVHLGKDVFYLEEKGSITQVGDKARDIQMENSIQNFAQFVGQDHIQQELEELEETSIIMQARDVAREEQQERNQEREAGYER